MKIVYLLEGLFWQNGCWLYRNRVPGVELQSRGHEVQFLLLGKKVSEKWLNWPDVVVYGRNYGLDPLPSLEQYKKKGKKISYDLDDDTWTVNPDNPSRESAKKHNKTIEALLKKADVVTTTTKVLAKKLKKFNKNVVVCPNALDFKKYAKKQNNKQLRIGFSGAASHWGDLMLVLDDLIKLQKKYDFMFILQGMCGRPIIAEVYNYRMILKQKLEPEKRIFYEAALKAYDKLKQLKYVHFPFYPPELFPSVIGQCGLDIGICPLKDNEFNRAKSCVKFYEYATVGAATLASNVLPYKKEVGYLAKKDWYEKLEKLIVDKKFRAKLLKKQWKFVRENRDIKDIAKLWEKVFIKRR